MSEENKVEPKKEIGMASRELYDNALKTETIYMQPTIFQQMSIMSKKFFESKALPKYVMNEAQAVVIMQSGFEMGMQPMESFKSLYILNGNITIWGAAVTRRCTLHGWKVDYQEKENECTAILTKGREKIQETVTFEEFEKSGSTKAGDGSIKANWSEGINRRTKLRYGALSLVVKTRIPEVMGVASEIKEVAEDWQVKEETTGNNSVINIKVDKENKIPELNDFLKNVSKGNKKVKLHQTDIDEQIQNAEKVSSPFIGKEGDKHGFAVTPNDESSVNVEEGEIK